MINISEMEFNNKKKDNKGFSLISEFRGDELTPITIFEGFKGKNRFILEGGSKENRFGRYSFLGENSYKEVVGEKLLDIKEVKKEVSIEFEYEIGRASCRERV